MARCKSAITMEKIAKQAGVSTSTVSRALSHPEKLSSATRLRVEEAVIASGYQVSRPSTHNQSRLILIMINNAYDAIHNAVVQAIKEIATRHNYLTITCYDNAENHYLNQLQHHALTHHICGIIQIGSSSYADWFIEQHKISIPYIVIGATTGHRHTVTIDIDHLSAAFNAVNYLCKSGYSRIAYVGNHSNNQIDYYHEQGFRQALQRWRRLCESHYMIRCTLSHQAARQAANQLMKLAVPPDAIYCQHDILTMGVLTEINALSTYSVKTQHDIAIISFGNSEPLQTQVPVPMALCYPAKEIGEQAFSTLIQWLKTPYLKPKPVLLHCELAKGHTILQQ